MSVVLARPAFPIVWWSFTSCSFHAFLHMLTCFESIWVSPLYAGIDSKHWLLAFATDGPISLVLLEREDGEKERRCNFSFMRWENEPFTVCRNGPTLNVSSAAPLFLHRETLLSEQVTRVGERGDAVWRRLGRRGTRSRRSGGTFVGLGCRTCRLERRGRVREDLTPIIFAYSTSCVLVCRRKLLVWSC